MTTGFIQLDNRRRAQLTRFLTDDAPTDYRVDIAADGVITLSPAQIVAQHELRLMAARPDLVEVMRRAANGELPADAAPRRRTTRA